MVIPQLPGHSIPQKGRYSFSNPEHTAMEKVWELQGTTQPLLRSNTGWGARKGREEAGKSPKKVEQCLGSCPAPGMPLYSLCDQSNITALLVCHGQAKATTASLQNLKPMGPPCAELELQERSPPLCPGTPQARLCQRARATGTSVPQRSFLRPP